MNETGYTVLKLTKSDGAYAYGKLAREFATGSTGAGGYLNARAAASGWYDVEFISAIGLGTTSMPVILEPPYAADRFTGATTVIGGSEPNGDLRAEATGYMSIGGTADMSFQKGAEYSGALYAIYKGTAGQWMTGKIGIGTTAGDISTSGYYDGNYTTRNIHEFTTRFDADSTDLTKTTTGSGVYLDSDFIDLQFNILNRQGELLSTSAEIAADPFVSGQRISILDTNGNVVAKNYRTITDAIFTFSRSQNIDVFGTYTNNFAIKNEVVGQAGNIHTSEFYLYGNTASFDKIFVKSSGQTVLNESYVNHNPPNTGGITNTNERANAIKYFNNQPINDTGVTGFIEIDLGFNENPNFTDLGNLVIYQGTSEDLATNRGSLVGNFPLNQIQAGQKFQLKANDGIKEGTPLFFKLAIDSEVGFSEELFNIGPFTLEPEKEGPDLNVYNQSVEQQIIVSDVSVQGGVGGVGTQGGHFAVGTSAVGSTTVVIQGPPAPVGTAIGSTTVVIQGNNSKLEIANNEGYAIDTEEKVATASIGGTILSTGSMIAGGSGHYISGDFDTIAGGAVGNISGGDFNFIGAGSGIDIVSSKFASSLGGQNNDISGADHSVILGGDNNYIATGQGHFLGGGSSNEISGTSLGADINNALVGGIDNRILNCQYGFIGAGGSNTIFKSNSVIGGGSSNIASGNSSIIFGGSNNQVLANYGTAAGRYSKVKAGHTGAVVFSDAHTDVAESVNHNTFNLHFKDGIHVTGSSGIFINGNPVVTGATAVGGSQTLQQVTDAGNTTTNAVKLNGGVVINENQSDLDFRVESDNDSHTLFVDGSTDNVGINNNTPQSKLDIRLTGSDSHLMDAGNVNTLLTLRVPNNSNPASVSNAGAKWGIKLRGAISDATQTNQKIAAIYGVSEDALGYNRKVGMALHTSPFDADNVERVRIDCDGNVGVGTTSPNAELEIAASEATIRLTDSDLTNTFSEIEKGGDYLYFYSRANAANGGFLFAGDNGTTETEFMRIDTAGKVGIGSNNPDANLDVTSNLNQQHLKVQGAYAEGVGALAIIKTTANGNALSVESATTSDSREIFEVKNSNGTVFEVQGDGNVGIGSNTPSAKLDVAGGIKLLDNNYLTWNSSNTRIVGNSDYLQFQVAASDKVRITSAGNVGIGTTNPLAKLDVRGDISGSGNFLGTGIGNRITAPDGKPYLVSGDEAGASLTLQGVCDNGNTTDTAVDFSGGAISITGGLTLANHIVKNVENSFLGLYGGTDTLTNDGFIKLHGNASNYGKVQTNIGYDATNSKAHWTLNNTTELMTLKGDGSLGIGITSPVSSLHVVGDGSNAVRIDDGSLRVTNTSNNDAIQIQASVSNEARILASDFGTSSAHPLKIAGDYVRITTSGNPAADEVARFTAKGNVGIGITNPTTKLTVDGTISGVSGLFSGNVGIGTSSPTQLLDVARDTDVSAVIGKAHVGFVIGGDYAGFAHLDNASSSSYALLQSAGGDTYLNCDNGNQLFFRKNNSTLGGFNSSSDFYVNTNTLYVDASESKVGIETTTPSYALDVYGTIRSQDPSGGGIKGNQGLNPGLATTLEGYFANTSTEDYGFQNALVLNDLAGFTKWKGVIMSTSGIFKERGGSEGSYTYSNEAETGDFDRAFQANNHTVGSWYTDSGPNGDNPTGTGVVEFTFKDLVTLDYGAQVGVIFGSNSFRATHVKIEVARTGGWQQLIDLTGDNAETAVISRVGTNAGSSNAISGIRYSLARAGNYFRINNFYATDYAAGNNLSYGGQYYIDKYYDGRHYSTLRPVNDGESDLGTISNRYGKLYADSGLFTDTVGIGTTSPSANGSKTTLHINSDTNGAAIRLSQASNSSLIRYNDTNGLEIGTIASKNLSFETADTTAMTIDTSQNVGIGTTNPTNKLDVFGHFSATSKSFLIDHPTKENKKLQYGSLEGPENGVYVRGTNDNSLIELPEYWSELVHEDSITVILTAIGKKQDLYVKSQTCKNILIGGVKGSYNYIVYGERKDIDKLEIELLKV